MFLGSFAPCFDKLYILVHGLLVSPQSDQERNNLQRQKIMSFIYPIYNRKWRNIIVIYIYIYKCKGHPATGRGGPRGSG